MILELNKGQTCQIDKEDLWKIARYTWFARLIAGRPYVMTSAYENGRHKRIMLHRLIMDAQKGVVVDHINGDGLDNRKSNLRICSHRQNILNQKKSKLGSSQFKGVRRYVRFNKWGAQITVHGKQIHLGVFETEDEAARAYDEASLKYFGDFSRLNFKRKGGV
jgi:hypothetical protein